MADDGVVSIVIRCVVTLPYHLIAKDLTRSRNTMTERVRPPTLPSLSAHPWLLGLLFACVGYWLGASHDFLRKEWMFSFEMRRHLEDVSLDTEMHGTETEEELSEKELGTVVSIALFLIILTIGFEVCKEHLEESVPEDMEIILEKLFGELTVLGFLSIVTFVITQTGLLGSISERLLGEERELVEFFEYVVTKSLLSLTLAIPSHIFPRNLAWQVCSLLYLFHYGILRCASPCTSASSK